MSGRFSKFPNSTVVSFDGLFMISSISDSLSNKLSLSKLSSVSSAILASIGSTSSTAGESVFSSSWLDSGGILYDSSSEYMSLESISSLTFSCMHTLWKFV